MRILCGFAAVILALFILAQVNDPDPFRWAAIYGIAAFWAGVGALRPDLLGRPGWRPAFLVWLAAAAVGAVWYWPRASGWWLVETWWENEESREGMGMMIVLASMLLVATALRRRA